MNWEINPVLDNHLRQRDLWEQKARATFYATDDEAHLLATFMLEALADFTGQLSDKPWPNMIHGDYYVGLTVSFIRTHFMVVRCAEHSHVIEGATLLRKQLEVIARLHELDALEDKKVPEKKTPNVGALKSKVGGLYGPLSEVAHSSVPDHFHLLGKGENNHFTSVYPKFSRNSYALLHEAGHVFLEFWIWLSKFNERHDEMCDLHEFEKSMNAAFKVMMEWDLHEDGQTQAHLLKGGKNPSGG